MTKCANPKCEVEIDPEREHGKYCSTKCRVAAARARKKEDAGKGSEVAGGAAKAPEPPQKKPAVGAADVTIGGCFNSTEEQRESAGLPPLEKPVARTGHYARQERETAARKAVKEMESAFKASRKIALAVDMPAPTTAAEVADFIEDGKPLPEKPTRREVRVIELYEDRQGRPVEPKKRGRKEVVPLPTAEQLDRRTKREKTAFPDGDQNAVARAVLAKVPRPSSMPAPVHIPASSILARMTSKLPSAPVETPRGTPIK